MNLKFATKSQGIYHRIFLLFIYMCTYLCLFNRSKPTERRSFATMIKMIFLFVILSNDHFLTDQQDKFSLSIVICYTNISCVQGVFAKNIGWGVQIYRAVRQRKFDYLETSMTTTLIENIYIIYFRWRYSDMLKIYTTDRDTSYRV